MIMAIFHKTIYKNWWCMDHCLPSPAPYQTSSGLNEILVTTILKIDYVFYFHSKPKVLAALLQEPSATELSLIALRHPVA